MMAWEGRSAGNQSIPQKPKTARRCKLMHFLFNLLYGGGHLAAWNSSAFPTSIQATIRRASALLVAGPFSYSSLWVLFWMAARLIYLAA
jgi:hypothetical protein